MKILLVEDDRSLAQILMQALSTQHYLVDLATDGREGLELAEAFEYDLILLDLMLPKLDGISFCQQRRKEGDRTPILLLTAQDASTKKVMGLDAGADDYAIKPIDIQELLARIRALLRRSSAIASPVLEWRNLQLNPSNCEVTYDGQLLHLTAKEYSLLELFLRNPQRIFSQSALLDHLWSFDEPPSENTVRAHVKSLRKKLQKAGATDLIETIYGLGYRLRTDEKGDKGNRGEKDGKGGKGELPQSPIANSPSPVAKSQTVTEVSQTPPTLMPDMSVLWERHKEKYLNRLMVLEQAVTALLKNALGEKLQQQAVREAHTLTGSLGSFGLVGVTALCREIEQSFQLASQLSQTEKEHLSQRVVALRQVMEQPTRASQVNSKQPDSKETDEPPNNPKPQILNSQQVNTETPNSKETDERPINPKSRAFPIAEETSETQPSKIQNLKLEKSHLLVVDDDTALALTLANEAKAWGMEVNVADNLTRAREAIARVRPDVVLLDLCFPDSTESGFELLAELAAERSPVPVLVFTAKESLADRVKAARLGARGFLQKPVSFEQVKVAIAQVLQQASSPEAKLLVVDDDPLVQDFLRPLLEPWGFRLTLLDDPQQFWETLEQFAPDLLILDVEMPELSGIDLCQVVRNDPRWQDLPVLFLSARTDVQTVHRVFAAGADDYVNKPIVGPELVARVLNRLERVQFRRKLRTLMG